MIVSTKAALAALLLLGTAGGVAVVATRGDQSSAETKTAQPAAPGRRSKNCRNACVEQVFARPK